MQYSLRYAATLLVAFSLAMASSSWLPPLGSSATLLGLIVAVRFVWNPSRLRWTVWGTVWGAVAFVGLCWAISSATGEPPAGRRTGGSQRWQEIARQYALPLGGIAGGTLGHALFVWASKEEPSEPA